MAHRSWCAEHGGQSNERLEFLGDAVLGMIVAEYTFNTWPGLNDGQLSKVRASVVNAHALAEVAIDLDIGSHLRLSRGEDLADGRQKTSILADAMEAVIGAVHLDGGVDASRTLVLGLLSDRIEVAVGSPVASDFKSRLQEEVVAMGRGVPRYELDRSGPDHDRRYTATVYVAGQHLGQGEGRSKKAAEQEAARAACAALEAEKGGGDA
jgi:ribonuclease-3